MRNMEITAIARDLGVAAANGQGSIVDLAIALYGSAQAGHGPVAREAYANYVAGNNETVDAASGSARYADKLADENSDSFAAQVSKLNGFVKLGVRSPRLPQNYYDHVLNALEIIAGDTVTYKVGGKYTALCKVNAAQLKSKTMLSASDIAELFVAVEKEPKTIADKLAAMLKEAKAMKAGFNTIAAPIIAAIEAGQGALAIAAARAVLAEEENKAARAAGMTPAGNKPGIERPNGEVIDFDKITKAEANAA